MESTHSGACYVERIVMTITNITADILALRAYNQALEGLENLGSDEEARIDAMIAGLEVNLIALHLDAVCAAEERDIDTCYEHYSWMNKESTDYEIAEMERLDEAYSATVRARVVAVHYAELMD